VVDPGRQKKREGIILKERGPRCPLVEERCTKYTEAVLTKCWGMERNQEKARKEGWPDKRKKASKKSGNFRLGGAVSFPNSAWAGGCR